MNHPKLQVALALISLLAFAPVHGVDMSREARPTFEVASIRPHNPGRGNHSYFHLPDIDITGTSVKGLIIAGYGLDSSQILGGPPWINYDLYDVMAKVDPSVMTLPSKDIELRVALMFRSLLQDRFTMKAHLSTKIGNVYWLVLAKGKVKLTPARPGERSTAEVGIGKLKLSAYSLPAIAKQLTVSTHTVVLDKTGLNGTYDIDLRWTPDQQLMSADLDATATGGVSLKDALREQLGLDLRTHKGDIPVLKIDNTSRPTPN